VKGFATAFCYTLAYALDIPDKAIAFSIYMSYWKPLSHVSPFWWLFIFIILPFVFNALNVRRFAEFEYGLTLLKIMAILGIIVVGVIIVGGGTDHSPLLATNNDTQPMFCGLNQTNCLSTPGFICEDS